MKNLLLFILFLSACVSKDAIQPPCYPDKGIKESLTTATIISGEGEEESSSQHITFDRQGKPILRTQGGGGQVKYIYDDNKLMNTIITNSSGDKENLWDKINSESIDTNAVTKHDQYGRALIIEGSDGSRIEFSYKGCDVETQHYFDKYGDKIHDYELVFLHKSLIQATWTLASETNGQQTRYYSYKYDNKGKWIERVYEHSSGKKIHEYRALEYY